MDHSILIRGLVVVLLVVSFASAEPPTTETNIVTIPLDRIWATSMPGTRDIDVLAQEQIKLEKIDLWSPLVKSFLDPRWHAKKGRPARSAFVVQADGLEALREAHAVLTGKKKPQKSVLTGKDVSLVFFSQPRGAEVQLVKVQRDGNVVELKYRVAPYTEAHATMDFALIPLSALPSGQYEVKITQAPAVFKVGKDYKQLDPPRLDESSELYVSRPFSFQVVNE